MNVAHNLYRYKSFKETKTKDKFVKMCAVTGSRLVTGETIRHAPPPVCCEKTLDRFRTREVTDVMPRVFAHLQQRENMYRGIIYPRKYWKEISQYHFVLAHVYDLTLEKELAMI